MLPPLHQVLPDTRVDEEPHATGPSREALLRSAATRPRPSPSHSSPASARRTSVATRPPVPVPTSSSAFATVSPRRVSTYKPTPPPRTTSDGLCTAQPLPPGNGSTAVEALSRIPREFFVVETNAVLPQMQYPPTQYQSTFVGSGSWETVVFPALTPHTRQQVLYLRQTLEKMRVQASSSVGVAAVAAKTVEYTEKEWLLHSLCFHELARQIKFICKEQSELLYEIQAAYDASQARLVTLVRQLQAENGQYQGQIQTLLAQQQQHQEASERQRVQLEAAAAVATATAPSSCSCGRPRRRRRMHLTADDDDEESGDGSDDGQWSSGDSDEEEQRLWHEFQRQRRMKLRRMVGENDDDDAENEGGGRRQQRASIVEENMAAARVQQAFTKYQHRKEAHRALQREEKLLAVLDIQRSYRGYKDRQRTLHKRAVMQTILRRRKQVAAVELLQMNVRAYLIKKRREDKYKPASAAAQASMLEAQRVAAAGGAVSLPALLERAATLKIIETDGSVVPPEEVTAPPPDERITQLMAGLSELAASFSFLHSRRRHAKRVKKAQAARHIATSMTEIPITVSVGDAHLTSVAADTTTDTEAELPAELETEAQDEKEEIDELLLTETIRRAEGLIKSFKSVISDLKRDAATANGDGGGLDNELTKATSTTTLTPANDLDVGTNPLFPEEFDAASFLFVDDAEPKRKHQLANSPSSSPRRVGRPGNSDVGDAMAILKGDSALTEEDDSDETHLDDVLWQTSVYTPRSDEQSEQDAAVRQRIIHELSASRDQQKRLVSLKQFIVDIYDTIVGKLSDLKPGRREKLLQIHASLALSFADGQRFLRGRHHFHASDPNASGTSEYEPVSAFIGRIDMNELIRDHFHCQVGLKHLVDASMERLVTDLHAFTPLDPDVKHFHEFLTHERSLDELIFFCLCRLFARDASKQQQSRQPVFHGATMREVIDLPHAMSVATVFFHAGGTDAELLNTDAFVIETSNEIYVRHLPSKGLEQLEVILQNYATPVDTTEASAYGLDRGDGQYAIDPSAFVRATNANQFHAKEYNAHAPRSPILRKNAPPQFLSHGSSAAATSSSSASWVYFDEFVDLLRRYRTIMRHFHSFIRWTYELFQDAYRRQKQQQLLTGTLSPPSSSSSSTAHLLEEAAFVETLLPFSLGANERELRNVFHNALKQRQLQRLMPVRVFVSVVLVLLRNGLLSVTSYAPLQKIHESQAVSTRPTTQAAYGSTLRQKREEKQWMQIALQWRGQEQHFEAAVERIYAAAADSESPSDEGSAAASQLLAWRNELYELFMSRSGRESLERAQTLFDLLLGALHDTKTGATRAVVDTRTQPLESPHATAADAVGSPWETETNW